MWTSRSEKLTDVHGLRFSIDQDSRPATFADVFRGWQNDGDFRSLFSSLLSDAPFTAFRWETPSVTTATMFKPFEFVLLDSPGLARRPDPEPFSEHFDQAEANIAVFPNVGGDAILIVPSPVAEPPVYGHLAAFVRLAPESQRHALWKAVGKAMALRVGFKPVWLNTAGAGVSWLHVRLDDRPKYYRFKPYTGGGE